MTYQGIGTRYFDAMRLQIKTLNEYNPKINKSSSDCFVVIPFFKKKIMMLVKKIEDEGKLNIREHSISYAREYEQTLTFQNEIDCGSQLWMLIEDLTYKMSVQHNYYDRSTPIITPSLIQCAFIFRKICGTHSDNMSSIIKNAEFQRVMNCTPMSSFGIAFLVLVNCKCTLEFEWFICVQPHIRFVKPMTCFTWINITFRGTFLTVLQMQLTSHKYSTIIIHICSTAIHT